MSIRSDPIEIMILARRSHAVLAARWRVQCHSRACRPLRHPNVSGCLRQHPFSFTRAPSVRHHRWSSMDAVCCSLIGGAERHVGVLHHAMYHGIHVRVHTSSFMADGTAAWAVACQSVSPCGPVVCAFVTLNLLMCCQVGSHCWCCGARYGGLKAKQIIETRYIYVR